MNHRKKLDIAVQREYKVVKANEIIQKARYDLNVHELKLLSFIFSKVKPTDTEIQPYTFSIKEYCQICGIDYKNGKNYITIKKSLKSLRDKSFWLKDENGDETTVGWLQKVTIRSGSGKIVATLDPDLQKYVVGLFENFTQYELLSTLPMQSSYSIRIYELLKSYAFTKSHVFDIADLKRQLSCEHYERFPDFRRKVIEIAVRDINLYTDLEVSWEPIKDGRKITQIRVYIKTKETFERIQAQYKAIDQIEGQMDIEDYYK